MPKNVLQENICQPFSVAFSKMLSELISVIMGNFYHFIASMSKVATKAHEYMAWPLKGSRQVFPRAS